MGEYNELIIEKAIDAIKKGNIIEIGMLMTKAQQLFDDNLSYLSPEELKAPKLHSVLNDNYILNNSLGGKGVGSQGEGTVQIIVKNSKIQQEMINYIENQLKLKAYSIIIQKSI